MLWAVVVGQAGGLLTSHVCIVRKLAYCCASTCSLQIKLYVVADVIAQWYFQPAGEAGPHLSG